MKDFSELALESAEIEGRGVELKERRLSPSLKCLSFSVKRGEGEESRPEPGRYHTLITEKSVLEEDSLVEEITGAIASLLRRLIGRRARRLLAVGLGNPSTIVDALGCETVRKLKAGETRRGYLASIVPSVFGLTGLETASVVSGVAKEFRPDLVLCVDTLSTRRAERLFRAVQIADDGIVPGGGVGNRRQPLSEEVVGAPVFSIGVPLLAHADRCSSLPAGLVVTPKEIDLLVPLFASAIAAGIERALQQ